MGKGLSITKALGDAAQQGSHYYTAMHTEQLRQKNLQEARQWEMTRYERTRSDALTDRGNERAYQEEQNQLAIDQADETAVLDAAAERQSQAEQWGEYEEVIIGGKRKVIQKNGLGDMRVVEGIDGLYDQTGARQANSSGQTNTADVVQRKMDAANAMLTQITDVEKMTNGNTTGLEGWAKGFVPGSDAYDMRATLQTLKSDVARSTLAQMREDSKTGGALGNVTERELDMLEKALGEIDPDASEEVFSRGLERVRQHYIRSLTNYQAMMKEQYSFGNHTTVQQFGFGGVGGGNSGGSAQAAAESIMTRRFGGGQMSRNN